MIEAMYGVEFHSNTRDSGFGVVILKNGKILGGDSSCVYLGNYTLHNGVIHADVEVTNDHKMQSTVFGDLDRFALKGVAEIGVDGSYKTFVMHGHMIENPSMKITVTFSRRAELS